MLWSNLEIGDVVRVSDELLNHYRNFYYYNDWSNRWGFQDDLIISDIEYTYSGEYMIIRFENKDSSFTINKSNGRFYNSNIKLVVLKIVELRREND